MWVQFRLTYRHTPTGSTAWQVFGLERELIAHAGEYLSIRHVVDTNNPPYGYTHLLKVERLEEDGTWTERRYPIFRNAELLYEGRPEEAAIVGYWP